MAGGETLMYPCLNQTVLGGKSDGYDMGALLALLDSGQHNVPPGGGDELAGSQNLWWLKAACLAAMGRDYSANDLKARLRRERDDIGLWGSEGTSPIYHGFIMTGEIVVWGNSTDPELQSLIEENIASFIWYAMKMGLDKSPHGLVGQRGAALDHVEGYPYLHFLIQYCKAGMPADFRSLSSWQRYLMEGGLIYSVINNPQAKRFWERVFARLSSPTFRPWRLRALTSILYTSTEHLANVVSKGINGNTPVLAAYARRVNEYLPFNYSTHVRQVNDHATCTYTWDESNGMIFLTYMGIYADMDLIPADYQQIAFGPVDLGQVRVLESSLDGVVDRPLISAPPSPQQPPVPVPPTPKPKKKSTWIERMGL